MARIASAKPSDYAYVTLPREYNLMYVGDALTATATVTGATGYVVRRLDHSGGCTEVAAGAWSGTVVTLGTAGQGAFAKRGHYTLALTGPDRGGEWGACYGTARFVVADSVAGVPDSPLRSAATPSITSGLDTPYAHGAFSLGGFRTSLIVQRVNPRRQTKQATVASGTSATLTMTDGGFNGATTTASHVFVMHVVNGDATGMGTSTGGYTEIASATFGTTTAKLYVAYGLQTPAVCTGVTTNAAAHNLFAVETQFLNNASQLVLRTVTGNGTSAALTDTLSSVGSSVEYGLLTFVGTAGNASFSGVTGGTHVGTSGSVASATSESYGGGRATTVTYTFTAPTDYVGFMVAYAADATYPNALADAKAGLERGHSLWGQYGDAARPRKVTVQLLSASSAVAVDNYSVALTQAANDTKNHVPGFVAGYTGRNEPQGGYLLTEAASFGASIHAAGVRAYGPDYVSAGLATVHSGSMFSLIDAGLFSGRLDGISYHDYNMCNNDLLGVVRPVYENLRAGFTARSVDPRDVYMTEGGYETSWPPTGAPGNNANLTLRKSGTQAMLNTIAREMIAGIPYENCYYYYDRRGGYDSVPMWQSTDSGPYAMWPMHRAFAVEVRGMVCQGEYDLGGAKNRYLAGWWRNTTTGQAVAAVIAGSPGTPALECAVRGADSLDVVDCFGNVTATPVTGGTLTLPVSDAPTYVRIPAGVQFAPRPVRWGVDRFPLQQLLFLDSVAGAKSPAKVTDGSRETSYARSSGDSVNSSAYVASGTFPRTLTLTSPFRPVVADRLLLVFPAPWQAQPAVMDFDVETLTGSTWTVRASFVQPASQSFHNVDDKSDTKVDCYTEAQHVFTVDLPADTPVDGVRLVVRSTSAGMDLDALMKTNPGATVTPIAQSVHLLAVEAYNRAASTARVAI